MPTRNAGLNGGDPLIVPPFSPARRHTTKKDKRQRKSSIGRHNVVAFLFQTVHGKWLLRDRGELALFEWFPRESGIGAEIRAQETD